jgi:hypothetical protein
VCFSLHKIFVHKVNKSIRATDKNATKKTKAKIHFSSQEIPTASPRDDDREKEQDVLLNRIPVPFSKEQIWRKGESFLNGLNFHTLRIKTDQLVASQKENF